MSSRNVVMGASGAITASGDPYFENNTLLLYGDGANGAQNNTFVGKKYLNPTDPTGYSVYLDGTGDYLVTASSTAFGLGTGDWTIECWVNTNLASKPNYAQWFVDLRPSGNASAIKPELYIDGTTNKVTYAVGASNPIQGTTVLIPGVWYHVAASRSSGITKLFINGIQEGSSYTDTNDYGSSNDVVIGTVGDARGTYNGYLNGYVSNVRIVKGTALYTTNFTVPSTPLTAVSGTSLLTCQSATIIDNSGNNFTITAAGNAVATAITNTINITRAGNTTQGSFSPYGDLWSNYFDGSGDYLSFTGTNAAFQFGTSDWTIETWVMLSTVASQNWLDFRATSGNGAYPTIATTAAFKFSYVANAATQITGTTTIVANTWYHVAVSRSGTSTKLFVNGVQEGSTYTDSTNYTVASGRPYIGGDGFANASTFNGYLSNVRIVKGTAVYTSNFTPSTTPLTAVSGTSLLTCQSNRFKDNSSNNFTLTKNGDVKVTNFSPFPPSLPYSSSVNGASAYFDGTGDYLDSPASNDFKLTGEFTVECWYYQNAVSTHPTVFEIGQYTDGILFRPVNSTNGSLWINNAQRYTALSTPLSSWVHVAVTRDASNLVSFYINGQRLYSATITGTINSTGALIRIGSSVHAADQFHNGYISEFRLVNGSKVYDPTQTTITVPTQPLTAIANTKYLVQFDNAGIYDATAKNNLETIGNVQINTTTKKYGAGSMYFDGAGDYLYSPATENLVFGTGDFTAETWMYVNSFAADMTIFDMRPASSQGAYPIMYTTASTLRYYVSSADRITSSTLTTGRWYHIAISRSSSITRMFIDGTAVGSWADTTNYLCSRLYIGTSAYTVGAANFNGYMDDFRVTKGIARYTNNFTPLDWGTDTALLSDQYYKYVSLLLRGNGTNGTQNNTFVDSSSNNLTITRAGNTTQGTFSPFSSEEGKWSNYFDGSGDYLSIPSNAAFSFGTGDFTIETWVMLDQPQSTASMHVTDSTVTNGLFLKINPTNICIGRTNTAEDSVFTYSLTQGVWYHILFSRSGSTVYCFVNGSLVGSGANSINYAQGGYYIGAAGGTGQFYKGYVSSLRMIKGTALYTANFTVPTSPLTAVSGTSLLTCQSNRFKDNSSNNFAITVAGDTKVLPYSPFAPSAAYDPLVNGGSGYFDGSGDNLSSPANSVFAYGTGDFTIEAWVYQTQRNTLSDICSCHNYGVSADWLWSINSSGNLFFQISSSGTGAQTSSSAVPLNAWTHVAVSRENGTMRQYINGVQVSSATYTTSIGSTLTFSVGASYNLNAASTFYGYISNLRIIKGTALYTSAFTPPTAPLPTITNTSLLCNFTNAGIIDTSGRSNAETIANAQISTSVKKYGTGSMYFDGSGDYVYSTSPLFNFGTNDFTIEGWFYFNNGTANAMGIMWCNYNAWGAQSIFWGKHTSNSGNVAVYIYNVNASAAILVDPTLPPNTTWIHYALVRNASTFTLYRNGIQVATTTSTASATTNTLSLVGGHAESAVNTLNGYVDDFRITNYARYTANFTPPIAALPNQ